MNGSLGVHIHFTIRNSEYFNYQRKNIPDIRLILGQLRIVEVISFVEKRRLIYLF